MKFYNCLYAKTRQNRLNLDLKTAYDKTQSRLKEVQNRALKPGPRGYPGQKGPKGSLGQSGRPGEKGTGVIHKWVRPNFWTPLLNPVVSLNTTLTYNFCYPQR